jgi:uncharacterized membrane protein YfcA
MDDTLTLAALAAGLALVGAFAGLMAGLLGIGGGVVMVPALYYVAGFLGVAEVHRMHLVVGTSLAVIVLTAATSVATHWRHGAVDTAVLRSYGPGVLVGVLAGTLIAAVVEGGVLTAVFAVAALAVSANMARGMPARTLGSALPGAAGARALGLLTGVVSTMAGIGGGAMTVAILTLYSMPIHLAVGTASAVGVLVALPGAIGFVAIGWGAAELPPLSLGYVNLAAFAVLAPVTAAMAPVGARLAHRLPQKGLARVFAAFLGLAALHMLWNLSN